MASPFGFGQFLETPPFSFLQVGDDLNVNELCFVEKLWTDRVRVFKAGPCFNMSCPESVHHETFWSKQLHLDARQANQVQQVKCLCHG